MTSKQHKDFCITLVGFLERASLRYGLGHLKVDENMTGYIDLDDSLRYLRYNIERINYEKSNDCT
jgi:hypothetical protein